MKQQRTIIITGIIVLLGIGLLVAMAGGHKDSAKTSVTSTSSSKSDTANAVASTKVDIKDYMFTPMAIKVKVGDTVTWTNQDGVRHNVVADKPSADAPNGPLIAKGETYSFTFKKAGTYTIHCMPHPYMHGTVIVTQ